jgi:hypothetical protein
MNRLTVEDVDSQYTKNMPYRPPREIRYISIILDYLKKVMMTHCIIRAM